MEEFINDDIFCSTHSDMIATLNCAVCGAQICPACVRAAGGQQLCHAHGAFANRRRSLMRLRQLFLLFLFAVFLYQTYQFVKSDKERTSPTGTVRVAVLQYIIGDGSSSSIVQRLNRSGGPFHIKTIQDWYNAERRRYGGQGDRYIEFDVIAPQQLDEPPPTLMDDSASMLMNMFAAWKYMRFFNQLAQQQISNESYGVRAFIIYVGGEGDIASHSSGSEKGRLAIAHINQQERNPAYALTTIAHELGHTLGASDHYSFQTFSAEHPFGFVEPFIDPLYPQRFAEVMAVDIPISRTQETEVTDLSQLRVGFRTAAEMQWISDTMAEHYYRPPAFHPEDLLPPRPVLENTPEESPGSPQDGRPAEP